MRSRIRWRIAVSYGILLSALLVALGVYAAQPGPVALGIAVPAFVLAGAGLAILLAFALTNSTLFSIREVTRACHSLASGDFSHQVPVPSGEAGQLAAAFNDMTGALEQMMAAVQGEQSRVSAILTTMSDGIVLIDGEGKVASLNPAAEKLLGTSSGHAVGRSFIEVTRDHELDALARSCLRQEEPASMTSFISHGGRGRHIRAVAAPIHDGHTGRALIILQDMTELRRAEAIRREFVANVSHELRTPIASLKALVETLEDGALEDPPAARDFLGRMHVEVDGLARLVEELLELSRIESGRVALKMEAADLGNLIAQAAERLRQQAERQGLTLRVVADDPAPWVLADTDRLQQVVINLVHNAIKFTPPGGKIQIRMGSSGGEAVVVVQDSGVGISEEDLPRLFERFYKVDKARTGGGTGLGLAIAKHLVQSHGGRIWAESPGQGRGATFSFALPIAKPASIPEPVN